jgi:hypothetical protein
MSRPAVPSAPGSQVCHQCGSSDLVRIRMGSTSGRPMVFVSCRQCEQRAWFAEDGDGTPLSADGLPLSPDGPDDERADGPDDGVGR